MSFLRIFAFCSLFLQGDGTVPGQQERIPAVQQTPFVPNVTAEADTFTPPQVVSQPTVATTVNVGQARFVGILMPARGKHVTIPAPERAILRLLATEKRDAAGNIERDSSGNPMIVPLKEGMNVFTGQVLGNFDDWDLRSILKINQAQLEVAKVELAKEIEVTLAGNGVQVARAELEVANAANQRVPGTIPAMEVMRLQYVVAQAYTKLALEKYNLDELATRRVTVQESELERTKVQIELRQLTAPIDGMIIKINAAEGAWLREGHEVLEILQLDTLWLVVQASVKEYEHSNLDGKPAVVQVAMAGGKIETFQGKVVFCAQKIDVGELFDVYIEVQNRRVGNYWLLQPGRGDVNAVIQL